MNGEIDILTLLSLVAAVVIFLKLRSVLGRKTGGEQTRYDRYTSSDRNMPANGAAGGKVVSLPRRGVDAAASARQSDASIEKLENELRNYSENSQVGEGLVAISRADRNFSPEEFLQGAKAAYEMIVSAFAAGNRKVLKGLVNSEVFEGFASAIAAREERGEEVEQDFVGIAKADIQDAEVKSHSAQITVKFVSELISSTLDRAGDVIAGDPDGISDVTDVWTFARDVNSRDPNWKLIATQAA